MWQLSGVKSNVRTAGTAQQNEVAILKLRRK